jgi:hypothetical protein
MIAVLLLAACAGPMRPAVIPKLSELPSDPERRNGVLDGAHVEPGPEQRPTSKKAQKAEGYAASAAAIIGVMLSNHENVTLGGAAAVDENLLFEDAKPKRKPDEKRESDDAKASPEITSDEPLVPWVRLK